MLNNTDANDLWIQWAASLVKDTSLSAEFLLELWNQILIFDPHLNDALHAPLKINEPCTLVAGSGKETLKTFNVSTPAAILAAAAGARIVKAVSRSVSTISGSADIVELLGLPISSTNKSIERSLATHSISFVNYATFCPFYSNRYNGVFSELNPFSFFMPISVLAISATSYVYGLSDPRVKLACETMKLTRPDLVAGTVVSSVPAPGEIIDEFSTCGITQLATLQQHTSTYSTYTSPEASISWKRKIKHQSSHAGNAKLALHSISPRKKHVDLDPVQALTAVNASLILQQYLEYAIDPQEADARIAEARDSGSATVCLTRLRT